MHDANTVGDIVVSEPDVLEGALVKAGGDHSGDKVKCLLEEHSRHD
jgi:hypothetical protein